MTPKDVIAIDWIHKEMLSASKRYPAHNSAHEGYAVLLEEVDELWQEVKKSPKARNNERMLEEAIQVGAMALRFIVDICMKEGKYANHPIGD